MHPLDRLKGPSSILRLTIFPLLAIGILEWTAFPLRAATKSHSPSNISNGAASAPNSNLSGPQKSFPTGSQSKNHPQIPSIKQQKNKPVDDSQESSAPPESNSPESTHSPLDASPDPDNEKVTVPKSSAIIVSFPTEIMLDPKRQHNVPITLPLVRPILDLEGNIVVPAKALVSAQLKPMKGGDLVEVIAVVIGGRVVPINAIGTLVPAQKKPEDFSNQYVPNPGRLNNVFNSLSNWQLSSTYLNLNKNARLNDYIGIGLAVANGLTTPKPKDPPAYVSISQGTVYILTLATPFSIPKKLVDTGIQIEQNAEAIGGQ